MHFVDKCDSAQFTHDEVTKPTGWILLSFIMDPRTGLGRYRDYSISNYQLMEELIGFCRHLTIREILELPDVQERVSRYFAHQELYLQMLNENSTLHGNVAVLDLRNQDDIPAGNRFLLYNLFPQANISIHVIWGLKKQNTVFTVGHSIFNRTSNTNVGRLMLKYGGGGHAAVGTCQVPNDHAEKTLNELIASIIADG